MKNGLYQENEELIYYRDDAPCHAGIIEQDGDIYYISSQGRAVKGWHKVHTGMTNGLIERGKYYFGDDYKLVPTDPDKNGLFHEGDNLVYYKHGVPRHAGLIKEGKDYYYISSNGYAVRGQHDVYKSMANDLLKEGIYTFGEDYKLVPKSFVALPETKDSSSDKKRKKKVKPTFKDYLKVIVAVWIMIALLLGVDFIQHMKSAREDAAKNASQEIVLPTFDEEVLLCSEVAKSVYDGEMSVADAITDGGPYRPFKFEYQLTDQDGSLLISESSDMSDADEYILPADSNEIVIDNLKTDTVYYYQVTVGSEIYPQESFKTAASTRFVNMPGVFNTRDIGGYTTLDGNKVKQGVLIRGTEIDGLVEPGYFLKTEAVEPVKKTFGFACDLDLREASLFSGKYQSRLGKNVKHKFYNSPMYGSIFSADYQPALRNIFADLADPDNYPMYLHCTYGADRTGTICFLLEGVLNMPEEVMKMDYQMTGFFLRSYSESESFNPIYAGVEGYKGSNIQEKIVNYLTTEVGVTDAQINSIRKVFID